MDLDQTIKSHLASSDFAAAATTALDKLGPQILGYLGAQLRDDDAAYDVFGHFCEELWKSIGKFRGEKGNLCVFIRGLARCFQLVMQRTDLTHDVIRRFRPDWPWLQRFFTCGSE